MTPLSFIRQILALITTLWKQRKRPINFLYSDTSNSSTGTKYVFKHVILHAEYPSN